LPAYGPIVQQVFGFLGSVIVGAAQVWGRFSDWLVQNWPTITDLASRAVKSISDQWTAFAPIIQQFITGYGPLLLQMLQYVADNAGAVVPAIIALIMIFGAVSIAILGLIGLLEALISKLKEIPAALNAAGIGISVGAGIAGIPHFDSSPPSWVPKVGGSQPIGSTSNTTININAPQQDPQANARAVATVMRQAMKV
jgi:hypothetical protein